MRLQVTDTVQCEALTSAYQAAVQMMQTSKRQVNDANDKINGGLIHQCMSMTVSP